MAILLMIEFLIMGMYLLAGHLMVVRVLEGCAVPTLPIPRSQLRLRYRGAGVL